MMCPDCGADGDHRITETRKHHEGVYRRRRCFDCGRHFVTMEVIVAGGIPKTARPRSQQAADLRGDASALAQAWRRIET